jgi:hypothetical protein
MLSCSGQFCQKACAQRADALRSRASTHRGERERLRTVTTSTQTRRDAPSGPNAAVPTDLPAMTPAGRPERRTMHLRSRHHGSVRDHRRHSTGGTETRVRAGHAMPTHTHARSLRISRTGYRDANSNGSSHNEQVSPHSSSPLHLFSHALHLNSQKQTQGEKARSNGRRRERMTNESVSDTEVSLDARQDSNQQWDPFAYIDAYPLARVQEIHLAGCAQPWGITTGPDGALRLAKARCIRQRTRAAQLATKSPDHDDGSITEFTIHFDGSGSHSNTTGQTARCGSPNTMGTR